MSLSLARKGMDTGVNIVIVGGSNNEGIWGRSLQPPEANEGSMSCQASVIREIVCEFRHLGSLKGDLLTWNFRDLRCVHM